MLKVCRARKKETENTCRRDEVSYLCLNYIEGSFQSPTANRCTWHIIAVKLFVVKFRFYLLPFNTTAFFIIMDSLWHPLEKSSILTSNFLLNRIKLNCIRVIEIIRNNVNTNYSSSIQLLSKAVRFLCHCDISKCKRSNIAMSAAEGSHRDGWRVGEK